MRTRRTTGPLTPPERRSGGRSKGGSHARGSERGGKTPGAAKPAAPNAAAPGIFPPRVIAPHLSVSGLRTAKLFAQKPGWSGANPAGAAGEGPAGPGRTDRASGLRLGAAGFAGVPGRGAVAADSAAGSTGRRTRPWSGPRTVRAKVVALLMVPIISLMALWGLAAVSTAQSVWSLIQLHTVNADVRQPVVSSITALQQERSAAMRVLSVRKGVGAGSGTDLATYTGLFGSTDATGTQIQSGSQSAAAALNYLGSDTQQRINTLLAALDSLGSLRRQVEQGEVGVSTAYSSYCAVIDDAFAVEGSLATRQDDAVGSNAQSVLQLAQAGEMLARQDAVLSAAYTAGSVSQADYEEFVGAAYSQNVLQLDAERSLRPADQAAYQRVIDSPLYNLLRNDQDAVQAAGPGPVTPSGVSPASWSGPESSVLAGLNAVATSAGTAAVNQIDPYASVLTNPQGIAVLAGFAAVLLSLLVSVRVGRGLVLELVGLRDTALDLARRRLPRAIARLRAGQSVDLELEAPPAVQVEDEIGQVAEALAAAARAAIQAAVERAEVVSSVAGVFLNLARRSQLLVHRQLALLDTMERRNEDPDELEDLFRLDHLATRMRRHAEGLIILSGATPGRGWRKSVPLMDVLRAAVAEVEDYARVDVRRLEVVRLSGGAVADLTHLIAELVENATSFSPPHTRVQVRGEQVGSGFAIDIEDRGLGMGDQAIADANRRIASAEQADLFDSDRLGLFVVSRLSRRHNIQVTLGRSAYGGTTAVVLLPKALLEGTSASGFGQDEGGESGQVGGQADGVVDGEPGGQATGRPGFDDGSGWFDGDQGSGPQPVLIGVNGVNGSVAGALPGRLPGQAGAEAEADATAVASATATANGVQHANGYYRRMPDPDIEPGAAHFPPRFEPAHSEPPTQVPAQVPAQASVRAPLPPASDSPATAAAGDLGAETSGATPAETPGGLPRRVRQAHLAPQLKSDPQRHADQAERVPPHGDAGTSPERARATMAAFQDGWARGRSVHGEPAPDPAAEQVTDGELTAQTRAKERS